MYACSLYLLVQISVWSALNAVVLHGFQKTSKTGNVGGLTDTAKYTGAHKERFDDSGKGKGIDGREYRQDDKGYVTGYKGEECRNWIVTKLRSSSIYRPIYVI
jgi:hypothetical protein